MKLPKYPSYKASGVEWLGDLPDPWVVKRARFSIAVNPKSRRMPALGPDDEVSFLPMDNVGEYGGLRLDQTKTLADIGAGYTEFDDGDVVIAKITPCFENGKGALASGLTNGMAFGTTELHVLRPGQAVDRRFLFYFTISRCFRSVGEGEMYGAGGQKRVPPEFCKNVALPLPPADDQCTIADFLDRETARIDALIAKKRTLIERLQEKRTALISRTVTRGLPPAAARAAGLDPNPKLKPSGIDWLGEVPDHWKVATVRRHRLRIQAGSTPPTTEAHYYEDGDVPWFGPGSFDDPLDVGAPVKLIGAQACRDGVARVFRRGATLIVTIGATLGKVAYLPESGSCNQQVTAIEFSPESVHARFATYQLRHLEPCIRGIAPSATLPILDQGEVADLPMVLPSLEEQSAIAAFLDHSIRGIDAVSGGIHTAVERLSEYRTALITAAVTGKIDVCSLLTRAGSSPESPVRTPEGARKWR